MAKPRPSSVTASRTKSLDKIVSLNIKLHYADLKAACLRSFATTEQLCCDDTYIITLFLLTSQVVIVNRNNKMLNRQDIYVLVKKSLDFL